jgi:hypothetical protein
MNAFTLLLDVQMIQLTFISANPVNRKDSDVLIINQQLRHIDTKSNDNQVSAKQLLTPSALFLLSPVQVGSSSDQK